MKRNLELDLLKIIACFTVIVVHVTGIIATNNSNIYTINHTLYYIGSFSIQMFFMVNGFFSLNKKNISYQYVIKKILNIIFIVFSWNMIIFLAKLIIKRKITNPFYTSFKNLIQQDYFWQFWFFGTMIIIYLILPILYKYFNDYKTAIILTVTFIAISLTIDLLNLIRSFNGYSIIQLHIIQTFRLWTWFAYFLLGGLLGKEKVKNFFLNHINNITNWCILSASIIIISIYQYNVGILYKKSNLEYFYDNIFTFIYSISLFILIYRQNFKQNKIIKIMSNNIMGIYIVHVTVIKIFTHFYKFNTPILNISFIFIVFICSLILTLVISKIPLFNRLIKIS